MSKDKLETENKLAQTDQDMVEKIDCKLVEINATLHPNWIQEEQRHIIAEWLCKEIIQPYGLAERQAGCEQGCESTSNKLEQFLLKWKQAGRKEVVEWIEKTSREYSHYLKYEQYHYCPNCDTSLVVGVSEQEWQAFKKSHNLED